MSPSVRLDRRPLLDTRTDAPLFVGRVAEVTRLGRSVRLGLNTVVYGGRGSGKTSLLRHTAWLLRGAETSEPDAWRFVHATAADVEDPEQLLHRLTRSVAGTSAAIGPVDPDPLALLERLAAALAPPTGLEDLTTRTVVVLDDLSAALGRTLFGALRDELWRLGITWVVACPDSDIDTLLLPPVDAFFETVIPLAGLDVDDAMTMVRRRLASAGAAYGEVSDRDLRQLAGVSKGNPRQMVDLVRAVVVDGVPVAALLGRLSTRNARLHTVSRGAAALAEELDTRGAVSPSDSALQRRMSVSRPRLVKLFGELRDAGLAEEFPAAPDGPGRPRVLYRLRPTSSDGLLTAGPGPGQ